MKSTPSSSRNILVVCLALLAVTLRGGTTPAEVAEFEAAKARALKGDAAGQYQLGRCYGMGIGVPEDQSEALAWCRKSAENGDPNAQWALGIRYRKGLDGLPVSPTEALKWLSSSAEQGDAERQFNLACYLMGGFGLQRDVPAAVRWFRKSADQGYVDALHNLGLIHAYGDGVPRDLEEADRLWKIGAEKGDPSCQYQLAMSYMRQASLTIYEKGKVVKHVSEADGLALLRKAADQGHVEAQFVLGNAYRLGAHGVMPDSVEAAKWYRKSAEQGHPYAQFSLALALRNGDGVKQDLAESIVWYRKSAEGGADKAQFNLGNAYWNGEGVAQDYAEAAKWYRKAAEQGMTQSQICLIDCLMLKSGGVYDPTEAYAWAVVASRSDPGAIGILRELDGSLSPAELAAGKQRAKLIADQIAARPRGRGWSR